MNTSSTPIVKILFYIMGVATVVLYSALLVLRVKIAEPTSAFMNLGIFSTLIITGALALKADHKPWKLATVLAIVFLILPELAPLLFNR